MKCYIWYSEQVLQPAQAGRPCTKCNSENSVKTKKKINETTKMLDVQTYLPSKSISYIARIGYGATLLPLYCNVGFVTEWSLFCTLKLLLLMFMLSFVL